VLLGYGSRQLILLSFCSYIPPIRIQPPTSGCKWHCQVRWWASPLRITTWHPLWREDGIVSSFTCKKNIQTNLDLGIQLCGMTATLKTEMLPSRALRISKYQQLKRKSPLQLSIQCSPQLTPERPNSERHGATRQQHAIARTLAKWSAYQVPNVIVILVVNV
jgi:hypothetical protein